MTTWEEVFERGKEAARTLRSKGRPTVRYAGSGDSSVDGWRLDQFGATDHDIEYSGSSDYEEIWVHPYLILGSDGVLYLFTITNLERGTREPGGFRVVTTKTPTVAPIPPETLHLTPYRALESDEVLRLVVLLAWKENSDTEPAAPSTEREEVFKEDAATPPPITAGTSHPTEAGHSLAEHEGVHPGEEPKSSSAWPTVLIVGLGAFVLLGLLILFIALFSGVQPN